MCRHRLELSTTMVILILVAPSRGALPDQVESELRWLRQDDAYHAEVLPIVGDVLREVPPIASRTSLRVLHVAGHDRTTCSHHHRHRRGGTGGPSWHLQSRQRRDLVQCHRCADGLDTVVPDRAGKAPLDVQPSHGTEVPLALPSKRGATLKWLRACQELLQVVPHD